MGGHERLQPRGRGQAVVVGQSDEFSPGFLHAAVAGGRRPGILLPDDMDNRASRRRVLRQQDGLGAAIIDHDHFECLGGHRLAGERSQAVS